MKSLKILGYWAIGWILLVINFLMGFLLHKFTGLELGFCLFAMSLTNIVSAGIGATVWAMLGDI